MRPRDFAIALIAIIVVAGITYGLAVSRPPFPPTPSQPFSMAPVGPSINGRVVMRVNGEPVTEGEFDAAFKLFPEEMQRQFSSSEAGKVELAEQIVRTKLLEQEARRLGLDQDTSVAGRIAAISDDALASAAAEKIAPPPTDAAVEKFYNENKGRFETIDLSHIVLAYAGGTIPPRSGGAAPSEAQAEQEAIGIWNQLRAGADFATLARKYSDDTASAAAGGKLGTVAHGMLPQELETRVFAIPTGQFSSPIPSSFGIHIFKVNARSPHPLDQQLRPVIAARLRQQEMLDRVEAMRRSASVIFDPKFFPDQKNWHAGKKKS